MSFLLRVLDAIRRRLEDRQLGLQRLGAFGRESVIEGPASIRGHERIMIGDHVHICPGATLSVIAGEYRGRTFDGRLTIGDRTWFERDLAIACCGRITIGNDVLFAQSVFVGDSSHEYHDVTQPILIQSMTEPRPVTIGDGAFVGNKAIILPGVEIGRGAFVGAGAVVTRDVPPHAVVVGNPARVIEQWNGEAWTAPGAEAGPA